MTEQKRSRNWIRNISYLGGLTSLVFIMVQAFFAGRAINQSNEWEKAKMTIENIERFKERINMSPLSKDNVWRAGDELWADISTPEGYHLTDTLRRLHNSLFDNEIDEIDDLIRMIDALDAFAYPIIMGYASETGSFQNIFYLYYMYSNFILPDFFHDIPLLGLNAKLLYRLWRIKLEMMYVDACINGDNNICQGFHKRKEHLLNYEGTDFSEASLKRHRRKLERKLKEVQKEIRVFRKNSLK